MPQRIEISPKTILLIAAILVGGWLFVLIHDILFLLLISFIIMSALRPVVDRMESWRIPRALGILILYVLLIGAIVLYGSFVLPPLITESVKLVNNLPHFLSELAPSVSINPDTIVSQIAPFGQNVARFTIGVFSNFISIVTILVFSFYFLLERKNLTSHLKLFIGSAWADRVMKIVLHAEDRMGAWVRGQLLLMLIVGQATYLGLVLLGVNYALPLALVAGLLEAFPVIGPNISAIPAILVALTMSPGTTVAVIALYILIQQLENNLIVPSVMRHTVGLPPVVSLLALMIGGRLAGVTGVILSVPLLLVIQTVVQEFIGQQQIKRKSSSP